jgi:hypothetical protein
MPKSVALRFKILRLVEPAWMVMGRMAGNTGGLSFTSLKVMMDVDKKNRLARLYIMAWKHRVLTSVADPDSNPPDPHVLWLLFDLFSLKNDVKVPSKSNM